MGHEVLGKVGEIADHLKKSSEGACSLGTLDTATVQYMKDAGVVRMLQPKDFGGYEATPAEFFEAVMEFGKYDAAACWVAGVVGVHPWELALNDVRLQEEVWGSDPDTWVASPYAPSGVAVPVDGGYVFNGRWSFSSGTDHCDWIVLGAKVGDQNGNPVMPPEMLHIMLPRADYTIVDDSWNVMGLEGTGSKDVIVKDAFIPSYRAIDVPRVMDGRAAVEAGRTQPLYRLPWSSVFPNAIGAAMVGICEGVLNAAIEYHSDRLTVMGSRSLDDPYANSAIAEAASDIRSARAQLLYNAQEMYEVVVRGEEVSFAMRAASRRDQIRVAWRAVQAADKVFEHCGGNAIRMDKPLQRFWRGAHAGLQHAIFTYGPVYDAWTRTACGQTLDGPMAATI
ncbi:MAG TPA: acyl-CoA dehydrogenase family protein [Ilumatobacter sp.]|nr:acyl-CoA dehydrogenase family protein [Ilumatobacter sp.]